MDMKVNGKHFLIVGLGKSGLASARFLIARGGRVTVTDRTPETQLADGGAVVEARKLGCRLALGHHPEAIFRETDCIVLSPGVPHRLAPIAEAADRGIPVVGEFELACRFIQEPIVAVTGTNGKTTTTTLIGAMLEASGIRVFVGGNIGSPLIGYADRTEKAEVVVAEVSSFQLDTIRDFHPSVAVLLNITDDHLDRYPDFDAYIESKMRIFENQGPDDVAVINDADPRIRQRAGNIRSRCWTLGAAPKTTMPCAEGARIGKSHIAFSVETLSGRRLAVDSLQIRGRHNLENVAAASLAAVAAGGSWEGIHQAASAFAGLPHRLESVGNIGDICFVDDSKATNVDAVVRALESFDVPVVLIMGGRDKGGRFHLLEPMIRHRVKKLILLGEAAGVIRNALGSIVDHQTVETMADAVTEARRAAAPGEAVLLSPGCASFDMYRSYAHRGEDFRSAVMRLTR